MVYHKKLPKVKLPGNTRRFGGKLFKRQDWHTSKLVADVVAKHLREQGYNVRITLRPESETGGYPLMDLWYVWKRKK